MKAKSSKPADLLPRWRVYQIRKEAEPGRFSQSRIDDPSFEGPILTIRDPTSANVCSAPPANRARVLALQHQSAGQVAPARPRSADQPHGRIARRNWSRRLGGSCAAADIISLSL
jgi:hypothetical protein